MGLLNDYINRFGEPTLGLLSSAAAEPVAGWAGLLSGGDAGAVERTRNALTYQPKSAAGKAGQNAMANALLGLKTTMVDNNPPVRAAVDGYNALADRMGLMHPALGAAVRTAPAALGLLAGPGSSATRSAVANVAKGTGKTAMRELGPTAGVMAENYMRRTGGLLDIFAGDGSKTANRGLLDQAKAMQAQGVPDEQIYAKTGWFNGMPDKKWRYEIPDNNSGLTGYDPTQMALDQFKVGGIDAMKAAREESAGYVRPAYRPSLQSMNDVLGHDDLYRAYPDTGYINYVHDKNNPIIGNAALGTYRGKPIITTTPTNAAEMKSNQLHELQHAVQQREGFAQGGSPDAMAVEWSQAKQKMDFDTTVAALVREAEGTQGGSLDKAMAVLNDLGFEISPEHVQAAMQRGTAQAVRMGDESEAALKRFGSMSRSGGDPGHQLYNRLAGEAEARLVQSRMNMTPAERAASYPPSMFDVPIDQQIVRFK